jgi:predicted flap endonuclease-1-like 5' DNA nuclease
MPEITVIHIALIAAALLVGVIVGWIFRGSRSVGEKTAINIAWQEQFEAQRQEHERLLEQNKSLMEQNSQYQASNKDSKMRAVELSDALKETFERRDELQRQIKDIRSNLESTVVERDQLQNDMQSRGVVDNDVTSTALQQRDQQITKLQNELDGWQERVPPIIERFRTRNEEAEQLEKELVAAQERIAALESMLSSESTHVEPVDPDALGDDLYASNDADELIDESNDESNDDSVEDFEYLSEVEEVDEIVAEEVLSNEVDNDARDNLKRIKGIGPAIEKTLHELGIFRFDQIADMSEYDIDRVAKRLKGFRSRIYREDWIGQSRDLLSQNLSGSA